jgi:hypothetical protein
LFGHSKDICRNSRRHLVRPHNLVAPLAAQNGVIDFGTPLATGSSILASIMIRETDVRDAGDVRTGEITGGKLLSAVLRQVIAVSVTTAAVVHDPTPFELLRTTSSSN